MNTLILIVVLLGLSTLAYQYGRRKALSAAAGSYHSLHSLPSYHGVYMALWCGFPALLIVLVWLMFQTSLIETLVLSDLAGATAALSEGQINLLLSDIRNLASGDITSKEPNPLTRAAADRSIRFWTRSTARLARWRSSSSAPTTMPRAQHGRRRASAPRTRDSCAPSAASRAARAPSPVRTRSARRRRRS